MRADDGADVAALAARVADAVDRARGTAGGGDAVDLRRSDATPVVDGDQVHAAAVHRATVAYERRAAARDAAVAHRASLASRRTQLLERAEWCESSAGTARALTEALAAATQSVDEARAAVEAAATRRDRVAEQRAAAQAAVEEARLELESLDGASLDETGVRRELEAATRTERDASKALAAAEAELATLRSRLDELDAARTELVAARDRLDAEAGRVPPGVEHAVADALAFYDELASGAGADPAATALADALARVEGDIGELRRTVPDPPTAADLEAVEAEIAACRRRLDHVRASASSFEGPPPQWWSELNALHSEVVDAEAAVQAGGLRKGAAKKRYEDALAAERARLDELGFGSYLDALMSGGRLPTERSSDDQAIQEATAALAAAERRAERLRTDRRRAAPLVELLAERDRLLDVATGLLGCDPAGRATELLADHPAVPPMAIGDLGDALRTAGVETAGVGVAAAARAWLDDRELQRDPTKRAELDRRLSEVVGERHVVESAMEPAAARAERAGAAAAAAARTVAGLEAELRARAGEDGRLLERATAARALRDQVEAVEQRLAAAETEALHVWSAAGETLAAAEAERDRLDRELADLGRRASRAAADLPPERRPAFDIVTSLVPLAGALRAEAALVADELGEAEAAVAATDAAAGLGPGSPTPDDVAAGLLAAVEDAAPAGAPVILAEPLLGVAADIAEPALAGLADASERHPTIVVTTDLAVVGWAIGLPADVGVLVAARALDELLAADPADEPHRTSHAPATTHPVVD